MTIKRLLLIPLILPLLPLNAQQTLRVDSFPVHVLNEIVVTGTKTLKRKTETPIIVNILNGKTLNNLQACNLSDGLKFQPGLRIETNCQTCNYTQLRMNGLQGGYSQILVNGRPIFSALMGLYGMEQLPVNMIERVEVVRGGGSSLYGSSAIGGTVNVITRLPSKNGFDVNSFVQQTGTHTTDFNLNANASMVAENKNSGITLFMHHRNRDYFDANGDNFSETPMLLNRSVGFTSFLRPSENEKIEFSMSYLNEYRRGGEMLNKPVFLTAQAEERRHRVGMGNIDYQLNFNEKRSSLIVYGAFQVTDRTHYTGIFPDSAADVNLHLQQPPYGVSDAASWQAGFQLNHALSNFFGRRNVLTVGSEYLSDRIHDNIPRYNYLIRQQTKDWGSFFQSDWDFAEGFNLLSGVRIDRHNLLDHAVVSPRLALLYRGLANTQFRLSYGTGFRAPQAFDTDLHIAFAGGGVSRVRLDPQLNEERSQSWSASVNYDKAVEDWVAGFTVEAFLTRLRNAFVLEHRGADAFGEIFEKTNGRSAVVQGVTLELRGNYKRWAQLEAGWTVQRSHFGKPVEYLQGLAPERIFLRTPDSYGYGNLTLTPAGKKWSINANAVYTGTMRVAHIGGADNNPTDRLVQTPTFTELSLRVARTFDLSLLKSKLEVYMGCKNVFNAYQHDFDIGKNRDSNFMYGPAMPRTYFVGLRLRRSE